MNPVDLIGPSSPLGSPAPYWSLVFFKVLGFVLHMIPMSLWYAGILVALLVRWKGGENGRIWSGRLMKQMPLLIALGVNFGIVPLLFTQVSYYQVFYPATILMAWFWLSVILFLTLAYYGVYIYAYGLKNGNSLTPFRQAAGWISAMFFIAIGFLFSNAFSLMTNLGSWPALAEKTGEAGAVLGTALNTADPTLWARWLMMFGLALTTTGAYAFVDAGVFGRNESDAYRFWAGGFALKVYTLGTVWFALFGSWYVFGTWWPEARSTMFAMPLAILTVLTAVSPGLVWLLLWFFRKGVANKRAALLVGFAQFVVLSLNAVSRQVVQNLELGKFLDMTAEPVKMQLSPIVLFLLLFVFGVGVVVWMVRKVIAAETKPAAAGS